MMHLSENTLLDFSQGLLTPEEVLAVEAHVDACGDCRALVAEVARANPVGDELRLPTRGSSVDRYLVIERRGAGNMGVVFAAFDLALAREVALKFLKPRRNEEPGLARERLLREAQALARVKHPNVVAVHDVGTWEGQVFLAMEFVDGVDLDAWLSAQPRSVAEVLEVFAEAGRGLAAVHEAGLVHRDFKPANVLVEASGRVRVTDFGLTAPREETPDDLGGTPAYLAPELHRGEPADATADQFAFCVALYEALYRQLPFGVLPVRELAEAVTEGRVLPAPAGSAVPAWVRRVLLRGLTVTPADRWPSMSALVAALLDDPRRRRQTLLTRLGVGAALVAAVALTVTLSDAERRYCRELDAPLAATWNADTRARLRGAFLASPLGERAWQSVELALDGWARDWSAQRLDSCRAARVRGEQSLAQLELRTECLNRGLRTFAGLVTTLEHTSVDGLTRATEAAGALEPVTSCADTASLRLRAVPPSGARETVEAVGRELADARARLELGQYEAALAQVVAAEARAATVRFLPLLAEAHVLHGRVLLQVDRFVEARAQLRRAHLEALESNDVVQASHALTWLVRAEGDGLFHAEVAHELAAMALAMQAARNADELERAETLEADGAAALRAAEYPLALARMEEALSILTRRVPGNRARLGQAHNLRANVLLSLARLDEAEAGYRQVIEWWTAEYGPEHPRLGRAYSNLCLVLRRERRPREALAACERAVALFQRVSEQFPELGLTWTHSGAAQAQLGEHEQAVASYTRALEVFEAAHGPDYPLAATTLTNRANELHKLARPAEAERDYLRALQIRETKLGPDHDAVGETLFNFAEFRRLHGRPAEALELYRRALAIDEHRLSPTHPFLAGDLSGLAACLLDLHQPASAAPLLERALEIAAQEADDEELGTIGVSLLRARLATHAPLGDLPARTRAHLEACGKGCASVAAELRALVP